MSDQSIVDQLNEKADPNPNNIVTLVQDCDALLIPSGQPVYVPKGSQVIITQALGGSYTAMVNGNLVRIAEDQVACLGEYAGHGTGGADAALVEEQLPEGTPVEQAWALMKTCYDPEIPVNIVDLGLVYDCDLCPIDDESTRLRAAVTMTLTAPGCGMGPVIMAEVKRKIERIPEVEDVQVELVFDPPWAQSMMSEAARLQLNLL